MTGWGTSAGVLDFEQESSLIGLAAFEEEEEHPLTLDEQHEEVFGAPLAREEEGLEDGTSFLEEQHGFTPFSPHVFFTSAQEGGSSCTFWGCVLLQLFLLQQEDPFGMPFGSTTSISFAFSKSCSLEFVSSLALLRGLRFLAISSNSKSKLISAGSTESSIIKKKCWRALKNKYKS